MDDTLSRIIEDISNRPSGPMAFRFILQPLMAAIMAIRSGAKDARMGKPPYLFGIYKHPDRRREMLHDGWTSIAKIFALATVLDLVYQVFVLKRIYPGESLIVATLLAIIPYALTRGPANRLLTHHPKKKGALKEPPSRNVA